MAGIRFFNESFADYMPLIAMEGMSADTLAWLAEHPNWDPRVRFADPSQRQHISCQHPLPTNEARCWFHRISVENKDDG